MDGFTKGMMGGLALFTSIPFVAIPPVFGLFLFMV